MNMTLHFFFVFFGDYVYCIPALFISLAKRTSVWCLWSLLFCCCCCISLFFAALSCFSSKSILSSSLSISRSSWPFWHSTKRAGFLAVAFDSPSFSFIVIAHEASFMWVIYKKDKNYLECSHNFYRSTLLTINYLHLKLTLTNIICGIYDIPKKLAFLRPNKSVWGNRYPSYVIHIWIDRNDFGPVIKSQIRKPLW